MNRVPKHETDKTCNVCGGPVVNQYGRVRCDDVTRPSRDHDNDLSWDSDEAKIQAYRREQKSYVGPAA